jgi:hypothetical protein
MALVPRRSPTAAHHAAPLAFTGGRHGDDLVGVATGLPARIADEITAAMVGP